MRLSSSAWMALTTRPADPNCFHGLCVCYVTGDFLLGLGGFSTSRVSHCKQIDVCLSWDLCTRSAVSQVPRVRWISCVAGWNGNMELVDQGELKLATWAMLVPARGNASGIGPLICS